MVRELSAADVLASDPHRRSKVTLELSEKVERKLRREFALTAKEVWVDDVHRVDYVGFSPGVGGRNASVEAGTFVFVEVKSCMDDFKSGHGLTFHGDENWLVCPRELADRLHSERIIPCGTKVISPDLGGRLRVAYDYMSQSKRVDSAASILWAMISGSYQTWRTSRELFGEDDGEA